MRGNPIAEAGKPHSPRDLLRVTQSRCLFPAAQNAISEIHLWVNKVEADTYQSAPGEAVNTEEHTHPLGGPAFPPCHTLPFSFPSALGLTLPFSPTLKHCYLLRATVEGHSSYWFLLMSDEWKYIR